MQCYRENCKQKACYQIWITYVLIKRIPAPKLLKIITTLVQSVIKSPGLSKSTTNVRSLYWMISSDLAINYRQILSYSPQARQNYSGLFCQDVRRWWDKQLRKLPVIIRNFKLPIIFINHDQHIIFMNRQFQVFGSLIFIVKT